MSYDNLKQQVCWANQEIVRAGLVVLTFGNASVVDRDAGVIGIKPSGVDYAVLKPDDIVVMTLADGEIVEGRKRPSSDTPTHLFLYRRFTAIGAIVHTHSPQATAWAQAEREIPCLGTTHADYFNGPVPLTRPLTPREIKDEYEVATGRAIWDRFAKTKMNPLHFPGVLVAGHAPFAWGPTAAKAVENALALETIAGMARQTLVLRPNAPKISRALLEKHFTRKHGPKAYYGQPVT